MLVWLIIRTAVAGTATLHVGVPHLAGTTEQVRVPDGVGPCARDPGFVRCESTEPVTFTWGGDPAFALIGQTNVAPGETGRAWVLTARGQEQAEQAATWLTALLDDTNVDSDEIAELRRLVVYTSDHTPPWPNQTGLFAHMALLQHPDERVRGEALEGLHPWVAGTPFDPTPTQAPSPLTAEDLDALTRDPHVGVRRRVARILRDARRDISREDVGRLLRRLLQDEHPGVRRAAVVALPGAVDREVMTATEAWELAVGMIPQPAPPGRAACNQLASLRGRLERAQQTVDVQGPLERVLQHHPERAWRVWSTWRSELPVREDWIRRLLEDTVGMDPDLVRHWQAVDPISLDAASEGWEPSKHPERRELLRQLRAPPGDDSLSAPPAAPSGP